MTTQPRLGVAVVVLAGCGSSSVTPSRAREEPRVAATPTASSSPSETPAPEPAVEGWLFLTKGAQPLIGGRLLSSDTMARHFGDDWRKLRDRRFRVYGDLHDHRCEPDAQCMQDGVIPSVRNVTGIELCRGCKPAPPHVTPVDCEKDVPGCLALCDSRGALCRDRSAGKERHVERCDSQHRDCREGCRMHGEPDPYCR